MNYKNFKLIFSVFFKEIEEKGYPTLSDNQELENEAVNEGIFSKNLFTCSLINKGAEAGIRDQEFGDAKDGEDDFERVEVDEGKNLKLKKSSN